MIYDTIYHVSCRCFYCPSPSTFCSRAKPGRFIGAREASSYFCTREKHCRQRPCNYQHMILVPLVTYRQYKYGGCVPVPSEASANSSHSLAIRVSGQNYAKPQAIVCTSRRIHRCGTLISTLICDPPCSLESSMSVFFDANGMKKIVASIFLAGIPVAAQSCQLPCCFTYYTKKQNCGMDF